MNSMMEKAKCINWMALAGILLLVMGNPVFSEEITDETNEGKMEVMDETVVTASRIEETQKGRLHAGSDNQRRGYQEFYR